MIIEFARSTPGVSIGAQKLWQVGPIPITNSMLLGFGGTLLLIVVLLSLMVGVYRGSRSRFVYAGLWLVESSRDLVVSVIGDRDVAQRVFPLAFTLLLFFGFNNLLNVVPLIGALFFRGTPLLRGVAADMNLTFALAIISMLTAQFWATRQLGFLGNLHRYFINPFRFPLQSFAGILEFLSEFSRGIALSLRIFGNVLGGEVLLGVMAYLAYWAAPLALPLFYILELFVGLIQAYIFFMLTVAYVALGLSSAQEVVDNSNHRQHST